MRELTSSQKRFLGQALVLAASKYVDFATDASGLAGGGPLKEQFLKQAAEARAFAISFDYSDTVAFEITPHAGQPPILQTPYSFKSSHPYGTPEHEAEYNAARVPHVWVGPKGRGGRWAVESSLERIKAANARSIAHLEMRILYEREMLGEQGGLTASKFDIQIGGKVLGGWRSKGWSVVKGLNKGASGEVVSVSTIGGGVISIEEVTDYHVPEVGDAEKVKKAKALPPLVNYRAEGCIEMTSAQWKEKTKYSDSYSVAGFTAGHEYSFHGPHVYRQRTSPARAAVYTRIPVFLTDSKVVEPPVIVATKEPVKFDLPTPPEREPYTPREKSEQESLFDGMRDALRSDKAVQIAVAPQLFPTPLDLARRMVQLAAVEAGECVLEPSAGTGNIAKAVIEAVDTEVLAYEINPQLCSKLRATFPAYKVHVECEDFLAVEKFQGCYPVILMNPPFENASDIKHIEHARKFLAPGGRLVAICANGPRQRATLMNEAEHWEDLPAGTFAEAGTNVNTALLVIRG